MILVMQELEFYIQITEKIETPIFMPVGTLGAVKSLHVKDIEQEINPDIILANTYHMYLRLRYRCLRSSWGYS